MKQGAQWMTAMVCLAGLVLLVTGCCTKRSSGDPKNQADRPWGAQGQSGTGSLPGGFNEKR